MKTYSKPQNFVFQSSRLFVLIIVFILISTTVSAQQVNLYAYSNNYMSVQSYTGNTSNGAYDVKIEYSGTSLNIPNWKLSVRAVNTIRSTDGTKVFPADKIGFIPVNTEGQAQPLAIPTISQIGIPSLTPLYGTSEVFLVPRSNAPLYNISQYNSYFSLLIKFNLNVAAGEYLADLQGGDNPKRYIVPLEFCLYGKNNELLAKVNKEYTIDVFRLMDSPTPRSKYSIRINGGAQNSYLELKTLDNYINGTSVTYDNALALSSNVDYQVTVHSSSSNFTSTGGYQLPLNTVNLQPIVTQTSSSLTSSLQSVGLSMSPQVIVNGKSTSESIVYFNLKYYTNPNDERLINAKSDEYKTILIYEITPK